MKTNQPQPNRLSRPGQIAVQVFGALLLLVLIVMAAGAIARASLKARYQPPGQMVDVGGYQLHISCAGEGSPTVVLDAGNGESSLDWSLVQPDVAKSTRVCAYDRPGYGWSDPSPLSRTPESNVKELHTLLMNAGIDAPYVLVAHSYGGLVTRLYTHTYPDEVAGMVLVDTPSDDLLVRLPPNGKDVFLKGVAQGAQQAKLGEILGQIGILPLLPGLFPVQANLPPQVAATERALAASDRRYMEAYAGELAAYAVSFAQMQTAHITTFGDIPLRVLSRGKPQAGFTEESEKVWQQLQIELASLSSNGKRIVAENSDHFIQLNQPDLVIGAIQEVLSGIDNHSS
jgi:pimeloyl-ACP methyl ester carboxylesterase